MSRTVAQLERKVVELEQLVKTLLKPKSRAKIITSAGTATIDLYHLTLTAAVSSGSGTATIRNMADDEEIETGATVVDKLGNHEGFAIGKRGICAKQDGTYYIMSMGRYVTEVDWTDPDLRQSYNGGASYVDIDEAEDC